MLIAPEVNPEPIRAPDIQPAATVETFGGGQGLEKINQQVQNIAETGGELAAFAKIGADQQAVEEAVGSKLSPFLTQLQQDSISKIHQASSMDEVHAAHDAALESYNKTAKKIGSDLTNGNQIAAYNKHAYSMGDSFNRVITASTYERGKALDKSAFTSYVDNTTAQAALSWGNLQSKDANGITQQQKNIDTLSDHADQYGFRNGMNPDEVKELKSKVLSNYHANVIDRMLSDDQSKVANQYFSDYKDQITQLDTRDNIETNLDKIPKQKEAQAKQAVEDKYKSNGRDALINLIDGKMSLSEVQRLYKNDDIDKSTYEHIQGKLSRPDIYEKAEESDPEVFNNVRQAQLNKSATPNEILRMISDGQADKEIRPDDAQYLKGMTKDMPASPQDKAVEAQANSIRDFGNRYFSDTSFFGKQKNEDRAKSEVNDMVSQFYRSADGSKATGEQLKDIRNQVIENAVRKKYPGIPPGKLPDIVVDIKGKVTRLLTPEEPSVAKPKYRVTPTESQRPDDE